MAAKRKKTGRVSRAGRTRRVSGKKVLVIDVGGTAVKILATGEQEHRAFPSGRKMTPK
jgi:NADPH-dependent glutamate synthase beta subunit-like oxidoreductase